MASNSPFPIYVLIGTKAQYIKMAPLLRLMQERKIPYFLIDTGQHASLTEQLRSELSIKQPDKFLSQGGNIGTFGGLISWMIKILWQVGIGSKTFLEDVFLAGPGLCLVHGDTASTLLATLLARRTGSRVAHVESGLRSFNLLNPFPEEIIRIFCMRFSDYLFAPSDWAQKNLFTMDVKGRVFNTRQNTGIEALHYALRKKNDATRRDRPYCVMTIHRAETIFKNDRLAFAVKAAQNISERLPVVFVVHDATEKRLRKLSLMTKLEEADDITCFPLLSHTEFATLLRDAEFVVTDGGSIQEECYYLDVPCLIIRQNTERLEGMCSNAVLCRFDQRALDNFVRNYSQYRAGRVVENLNPSKQILDIIMDEMTI